MKETKRKKSVERDGSPVAGEGGKVPKPWRDDAECLQVVMDNIREHINIIAPDGTVLWHHCGSDGEQSSPVGEKCWDAFEHRSFRCAHCVHPDILEDGKPREYEACIQGKERLTRSDWWVRAVPLRDKAGNIYAILEVASNISEKKQQEEDKRRYDARLQQVQRMESLGVLAGGIAHDFNNLIMGIMGNADLALMDLPAEVPARARLESIADGARRAAELCRQMLDYSGRGQLAVEWVDLNELIREMCGMLRVAIGRETDLRYDFAGDVPRIIGDSTQVRQVVMNLVINAAEAIGSSSGTITIRTGKRACAAGYLESLPFAGQARKGDFSFMEVEDTGCGMDRATQERIFEPYFTTKATGRGLGMGIVLGVVKSHKGALVLDSVPGKGSRLRVLFPITEPGPGRTVGACCPKDAAKRGNH